MGSTKIKTRVLILSDTHGLPFPPPLVPIDVLIHCGDLTDGSFLSEYTLTASILASINAPLKFAIPGNHDFTLNTSAFTRKVNEASPPLDPVDVERYYGAPRDARGILEDAGVRVLDEGVHVFRLANGGLLRVYASPFTPSVGCGWGFQYHPDMGHEFDIRYPRSGPNPSLSDGTSDGASQGESALNIDIALTHGPPRGILDYTSSRERAGCPDLFAAIASARPQVHAFGHIHEGWGAKLVTWRDPETYRTATHFTAIDNNHTSVISKSSTLQPSKHDSEEDKSRKRRKREEVKMQGYIELEGGIERGQQTLFVNASIADSGGEAEQLPWVVEVNLDREEVEVEVESETRTETRTETETETTSVEGVEESHASDDTKGVRSQDLSDLKM